MKRKEKTMPVLTSGEFPKAKFGFEKGEVESRFVITQQIGENNFVKIKFTDREIQSLIARILLELTYSDVNRSKEFPFNWNPFTDEKRVWVK